MRLTGTPGLPAAAPAAPADDVGPVTTSASASVASAAPATLQSAVLQPARAAMRDLPDIDHAKVAALRDALAKGEVPFDPAKLAGLIQRFHGSR